MRIYGSGTLIHQSHSDEGIIEVVDDADNRSLHFGTTPRQSTMSLSQPHQLQLTYTQAMMACLLLNPKPRKVLIIGLGGGSLVKFLLHHFPDCQIDVIEYRADVIQTANTFFDVPANDPRIHIQQADAYAQVKNLFYDGEVIYDTILVDAYDHNGMSASVGVQAFFDACSGLLTVDGVMSINLWGSDRAGFNMTMQRIDQSFRNRSMIVPVENKGNVIALATHQDINQAALKRIRPFVDELEMQYQINLPRSLQTLIRQNRGFIRSLFAS